MKKWLPVGIIIGLLVIIGLWVVSIKNNALRFNQATEKEWGNVNTSYQRRNDLIQNLVNTVKGAADVSYRRLASSKLGQNINVVALNQNLTQIFASFAI